MSRTPPRPELPALPYAKLFADPEMFDSQKTLVAAGFMVKRRSSDHKMMVASHSTVPGYLFKKFGRRVPCGDQRENYRTRVRGAEEIRALIEKHRLGRLTVVRKWIYQLPPQFASGRRCPELLVVERADLLSKNESKRRYQTIDRVTLEQLCRVLHAFSGFDAAIHNLKFTTAGQIAFFDTESYDRPHRPIERTFRYLFEELTKESRKIAERMFEHLDDEQ